LAKPRPGWKPAKPFPKGTGGNPAGKPKGTKDRTPRNVWDILRARGDKDPLDVLSSFASSELVEPNLRIQAAATLAGYRHGRRPSFRYVEEAVGLKAPVTIEEARQYLARVAMLVATGRLDVDSGQAIANLLQAFIDSVIGSQVDERLRVLEELAREQATRGFGAAIVVEGGLPALPMGPGDRPVIMPHTGPPVIEGKPNHNPWSTPDVGSAVNVTSKKPDPEAS
jgi:hypothetical protein